MDTRPVCSAGTRGPWAGGRWVHGPPVVSRTYSSIPSTVTRCSALVTAVSTPATSKCCTDWASSTVPSWWISSMLVAGCSRPGAILQAHRGSGKHNISIVDGGLAEGGGGLDGSQLLSALHHHLPLRPHQCVWWPLCYCYLNLRTPLFVLHPKSPFPELSSTCMPPKVTFPEMSAHSLLFSH